jgi:cell division protein FtsA
MFSSAAPYIVGLEIGTSKVCAVVGHVGPDDSLQIVGVGQAKSYGVRKGEIQDAGQAEEDVRRAIFEAEQMADIEIFGVFLGVTGGHVRGFTNHGVHPVASADREITEDDVRAAIRNARTINLPAQNHSIHAIRQRFIVEGKEYTDPVGMLGSGLEVDVHVVHGNLYRLQNAVRTVKGLQLEVEDIAFNGVASALAVASAEQKEIGCVVIDIGGGTTEYVAFVDGIIRHTGVFALGGDHVSNDVGYGLVTSVGRAEDLKIRHGSALVDDSLKGKTITMDRGVGRPQMEVSLHTLHKIMSARLEEIFQLIAQDLAEAGVLGYLRGGAILCGGCSKVPGITSLGSQVLQMPVVLGKTAGISGLAAALDEPEFATGIGLVKFGALEQKRRVPKNPLVESLKSITQFFKRA